jgi:hypothetical protein
LEIRAQNEDHYVVSLLDADGRIWKMLGIELVRGLNRFQVNDLGVLNAGPYYLDVMNSHGISLYSTELFKQ